MEDHIESVSSPEISLPTPATYWKLYFYLMGCEIKSTHIRPVVVHSISLGERDYKPVLT